MAGWARCVLRIAGPAGTYAPPERGVGYVKRIDGRDVRWALTNLKGATVFGSRGEAWLWWVGCKELHRFSVATDDLATAQAVAAGGGLR